MIHTVQCQGTDAVHACASLPSAVSLNDGICDEYAEQIPMYSHQSGTT